MVIDFAQRIQAKLPQGIQLLRVMLRETATSYAEWVAADQ
jgi:6-pyruvoyltetrahydropterin/6-carboxytetrahydropterin synthase